MTTLSPSRRLRSAVTLLAAVTALTTVSPAFAQSAADEEQAKELVTSGRKLRGDGDHKTARDRFRAAWKLVKSPIIGLDLAREHEILGELVEAFGVCDEISRIPPRDTESAGSKAARADAAKLSDQVGARIPKLTVELSTYPASSVPRVFLDGAELPLESLVAPRTVNPGEHVLAVRVTGADEATTKVTLAEKEKKTVKLTVPEAKPVAAKEPDPAPVAAPAPPKVPSEPPPTTTSPKTPVANDAPATSDSGSSRPLIGLIVGGAGLVTMGVGGIVALSAKSSWSAAKCDANDICDSQADVDMRHDAIGSAKTATIIVGVGAALVVGGAVLWLTAPSKDAPKSATRAPAIGVGPGGLVIRGVF